MARFVGFLFILVFLLTSCGKGNSSGAKGPERNVDPLLDEEGAKDEALYLVNSFRSRLGLSRLNRVTAADVEAEKFSQIMSDTGMFNHNGMETRCRRLRLAIGGNVCAEVIARGRGMKAQEALDAWKRSWSHRSRLEDPRFNTVGLGLSISPDGRSHWVMIFIEL